MASFMDDILDRLLELHAEIEKGIKGLPAEALDWIPGPAMNSISVLVVHLVGAERYWIGVAGDQPPARDREAEFKTTGMSANDLISILSDGNDFARMHLSRMQLSDLQVIRQSPRNSKSFSIGWCLAHALEHTALHTGHIQLTRQLWDQKRFF